MPARTYDPKLGILTVNGIPINGFANGTHIVFNRTNDMFTKSTGADGITTRVKSNDYSGEATFTLDQTSPSNDFLSSLALIDEAQNGGVVPIAYTDFSGRTTIASSAAWVRKIPETGFSNTESSTREWIFDCADMSQFVGGNPDN